RSPRDGRLIEKLGFFNPLAKGGVERLKLDVAKSEAWLAKGAQPSDRVASLIKEAKKSA
ncbi:30S ribosomal protein S16, partial [Francisella tularensis]|uniref:30S ribosomal protein S16 n=1 Tax=Francisella tularensis TaxID=263 RepID=UPI0023819839